MKKLNKNLLLLFLLLTSFVIRVIYIVKFAPSNISIPSGDALGYHQLAQNLVKYKQLTFVPNVPTARREPLYPIFLAAIYKIFGESLFIVRISQVVINVFSIYLIYLIGKKIFDEIVGLIAAGVASFWPNFIYYCGAVLREIFFTFLLLVLMYLVVKNLESKNWLWQIFLGVIGGLSALTKTEAVVVFVGIVIYFIVLKNFSIKSIFIICLLFVVTYSTWVYRNYKVFKTFVLGCTFGGVAFWTGTDIIPFEIRGLPEEKIYQDNAEDMKIARTIKNEVEENNFYYKRTIKFYLENPAKFFTLGIKKFLKFWRFLPYKGRNYGVNEKTMRLIGLLFIPVFFLFIIGIFLLKQNFKTSFVLLLPIICLSLVYCIFFAQIRYRIPVEPYLIIIAANALKFLLWKTKILIK